MKEGPKRAERLRIRTVELMKKGEKRQKVLFLCTHNSCRSQMAEGLLRSLGGEHFQVFSAGTDPGSVSPLAVKVMAEIGVDISGQRSKSTKELPDQELDYVITVCDAARRECPYFPGEVERLHWDILDPADTPGSETERLGAFRAVRDALKQHIRDWIRES